MYLTTIEYYQNKLKKYYPSDNFKILQFTQSTGPVIIQCQKCKNIMSFNRGTLLYDVKKRKGRLCHLCSTKTIQNVLLQCKINDFEIVSNSGKVTKKWEFLCKKCNQKFMRTPSADLQFCPCCGRSDKKDKPAQEWQNQFDKQFGIGEFTILDDKITPTSRKICIRHKCGFIKVGQAYALLNCKGCPKCAPKTSKGEQKIINFLDSHCVDYQYQVQMGNTRQSFDFKIGNVIIEYNGEQHYKPIQTFGGIKRFQQQQFFDKEKEKYCIENNLELITIPYTDFDNIDSILNNLLKRLNDQTKVVSKD